MMAQLPSKVGFGWAVRIIALFDAVMLGIAIFTVKTRLPPKKRDRLFNPAAFRQPEYACVALASGFFLFASFVSRFQATRGWIELTMRLFPVPTVFHADLYGCKGLQDLRSLLFDADVRLRLA